MAGAGSETDDLRCKKGTHITHINSEPQGGFHALEGVSVEGTETDNLRCKEGMHITHLISRMLKYADVCLRSYADVC